MNKPTLFNHLATLNTTTLPAPKQTESNNEAAFVYIIHGTKQFFFEKNSICYTEGELIYISAETTFFFQNIPNEEGNYLEIKLSLPKTLLFSFFTEEPTEQETPEMRIPFGYCEKIISETASEKLKIAFISLQTLLATDSKECNEIYDMKRIEILQLVFTSELRFIANKLRYDITSFTKDLVFPAWSAILSGKKITEIAALCKLPLFSFKQQFKKATGSTPYNWILMHRLIHAQFLLCTTNKSVSAIASKCCFNAESHFTKLFKREFGITPSNYRKKSLVARENPDANKVK